MDNELVDISTSLKLQLGYGVGHVLNDVCASLWFTYFLVYFHLVLEFSSSQAGSLMLIGQVVDALSTPFVGYFSDHSEGSVKYGKRKLWHLFGSACILASFPFIFSECIGCSMAHKWAQMFYYSSFILIFQIGWAASQISHLSLIPELSNDDHVRLHLNAIRYGFTVFSNLFVFIITWAVVQVTDNKKQIGPGDETKFHYIVIIVMSVGIICTIMFHSIVKEKRHFLRNDEEESEALHQSGRQTQCNFLKKPALYMVGITYMSTRLVVNVSQMLVPLYLHKTLKLSASTLAVVPLSMYLGSLLAAAAQRFIPRSITRKINYALGVACVIPAYVWIYFGTGDNYNTYFIYIVAVMIGFGGATLLITSLATTADLVGSDTSASAFVYGLMSFTDKLSCGIAIAVIQYYADEFTSAYYRIVLAWVCGCAAVLGLIIIILLPRSDSSTVPSEPINNQ